MKNLAKFLSPGLMKEVSEAMADAQAKVDLAQLACNGVLDQKVIISRMLEALESEVKGKELAVIVLQEEIDLLAKSARKTRGEIEAESNTWQYLTRCYEFSIIVRSQACTMVVYHPDLSLDYRTNYPNLHYDEQDALIDDALKVAPLQMVELTLNPGWLRFPIHHDGIGSAHSFKEKLEAIRCHVRDTALKILEARAIEEVNKKGVQDDAEEKGEA